MNYATQCVVHMLVIHTYFQLNILNLTSSFSQKDEDRYSPNTRRAIPPSFLSVKTTGKREKKTLEASRQGGKRRKDEEVSRRIEKRKRKRRQGRKKQGVRKKGESERTERKLDRNPIVLTRQKVVSGFKFWRQQKTEKKTERKTEKKTEKKTNKTERKTRKKTEKKTEKKTKKKTEKKKRTAAMGEEEDRGRAPFPVDELSWWWESISQSIKPGFAFLEFFDGGFSFCCFWCLCQPLPPSPEPR